MNKFDQIRSLDKKLKEVFSQIENISKEDSSEALSFGRLIKGFKQMYFNIKSDLVDPYYESKNPNIEDKIIERLEALVKVINIVIDFEK
jgi:hypothetical protein